MTRTNENWSEQQRQALENQFITALSRGVGGDYEGVEFVIALEEIIKISLLGTHHLLVYVTKNGMKMIYHFNH